MTILFALLAVLSGAIGAFAPYLSSPNQKMLERRIPLQRGVLVGSAALIASVVFFLQTAGPATSIYLLLTLVMLLWSALPLFFGWLRYRKSRRS